MLKRCFSLAAALVVVCVIAPPTGTSGAAAMPPIRVIVEYGQSLSVGADGLPILSVTQPFHNLTFGKTTAAFIPLTELHLYADWGESPASGLANTISALSAPADQTPILMIKCGKGGKTIAQLAQGTRYYKGCVQQIGAGKALAAAQGAAYSVVGIDFFHGESDSVVLSREGARHDSYAVALKALHDSFTHDIQAITGQTTPIPLFINQMDSFTTFGQPTSGIPVDQYVAAQRYPADIVLTGPKYQYPYSNGVHMTNVGYRWAGSLDGKVIKQVVQDGQQWTPLSPRSVTLRGATITLRLAVPSPPIVVDTHAVTAAVNDGFVLTDATPVPPLITEVRVESPDTLVINLERAPAEGSHPHLQYAMFGTPGAPDGNSSAGAAHGNIRDSDPTLGIAGDPLYNWLVHFDLPL